MVPLEEGAAEIRILAGPDSNASDEEKAIASTCKELGKTRVSVLSKVGIIERSSDKIAKELDTMARNAALELGGNAAVATGKIDAGERRYRILDCPFSS